MEGLTYLIPTESKHPREAYRFLEWAMSAQVQVQQTLKGGASIRKSVYDDPSVKAIPYTSTFIASVPVAKPKPTIPESAAMIEAMERHVADILNGRASAQSGLDSLALDLQHILGIKGDYGIHSKPARCDGVTTKGPTLSFQNAEQRGWPLLGDSSSAYFSAWLLSRVLWYLKRKYTGTPMSTITTPGIVVAVR